MRSRHAALTEVLLGRPIDPVAAAEHAQRRKLASKIANKKAAASSITAAGPGSGVPAPKEAEGVRDEIRAAMYG